MQRTALSSIIWREGFKYLPKLSIILPLGESSFVVTVVARSLYKNESTDCNCNCNLISGTIFLKKLFFLLLTSFDRARIMDRSSFLKPGGGDFLKIVPQSFLAFNFFWIIKCFLKRKNIHNHSFYRCVLAWGVYNRSWSKSLILTIHKTKCKRSNRLLIPQKRMLLSRIIFSVLWI